jgi:uncharacterized protein YkwD
VVSLFLITALLFSTAQPRDLEKQVFAVINERRRAQHLPALVWNDKIAAVARQHSVNMARGGFFSHVDPTFGEPSRRLTRAGVAWTACAENIFEESGMSDPVRAAVDTWLHSPGHRRNILDRQYTHSGVGIALSRDGTYTMTQEFVTLGK